MEPAYGGGPPDKEAFIDNARVAQRSKVAALVRTKAAENLYIADSLRVDAAF